MRIETVVAAEARESRGKNEARRVRVSGRIPAVIYGAFQDPRAVSLNPKDILRIIHSKTGHNSIFDVEVAGVEKTPVIVADEQYHPVKGTLMHIDLKRIDLTRKLRVSVPIHVTGEAKGVKQQGGVLDVVTKSDRNRVHSGRHPESIRRGCYRIDDRHQHPRLRSPAQIGRARSDCAGSRDRARGRHQGRSGCPKLQPRLRNPKWRRRARRKSRRYPAAAAPAEKGKKK